jgi:SAM-dependent methyltransferase
MPLSFHSDRDEMFRQQAQNSEKHIIPFIESVIDINDQHVLEIGCGEGGVLRPFLQRGCTCVGIDVNASKIQYAQQSLGSDIPRSRAHFLVRDVYDPGMLTEFRGRFDLILLLNTIEHIPEPDKLMLTVRDLLKPQGLALVSFPPWFMPYAGHQQMTESWLGKLPCYHLLPRRVYRGLLSLFGESEIKIRNLMSIFDTRVTIQGFEKRAGSCGYRILKKRFYLINPIYELKFGLPAVKQLPIIRSIPWFRDFISTTCYYILQPS